MTYYVVCPDIDPLTTAAADFFQQLGTGKCNKFVLLIFNSQILKVECITEGPVNILAIFPLTESGWYT